MPSVIVSSDGVEWCVLAGGIERGRFDSREAAVDAAREQAPLGTTVIIDARTDTSLLTTHG